MLPRPSRRALLVALVALGPVAASAAGPPAVRWRHALPGWGQPAVDDTTAFFLTRTHEVAALDAGTGVIRWRTYTGGPGDTPLGSSVRLSGPHVIVGDDAVVALDRATGRPAWRFVPAHGRSPGVFLGDTGGGLVFAGSLSGDLYALDAASGVLRWSARLASSQAAVYAPAVADGRAVVAFTEFGGRLSGGLAAFDVDGTARWKRPLPAGLGATGGVLIDRSRVLLAATDGSIRAFSLRDGRPLWRLAAPPSRPANGPANRDIRALVRSGRLLVAASLNGELAAYDLDTRRRRWRYANGPSGAAALRLAADSTHVYAPYTDGSLVAVAVATGRERWRTAPAAGGLEWPPYADGKRLIAAGSRGIVALETGPGPAAAGEQAPQEDR